MKFEFTTDIKNHSQIYVSKRHPTYLCCMSNEDIKKYIIECVRVELNEANDQLRTSNEKIKKLKTENKEQEKSIEELQIKNRKYEKDIEELQMECIRHEKIIDEYEADIEGYQVDTETFETEIDEHEKKEKELQMVIAEYEKKEKELQIVIAEQKKEIYNYEESINWDENEMINLKDENKKYEHLFTVLKKVVKICEPGYLGNYVSEIRNVLSEEETEETEISEELEILEETEISEGLKILEELEKTKKQVSYLENLIKTQQDLSKENKKQIKLYKKSSVAMSDKQ